QSSESISSQIGSIAVPTFDVAAMRARVTRAEVEARNGRKWLPLAMRVAAAIVLAAGAAWASPMRGWIAKQFRSSTAPVSAPPTETPATTTRPPSSASGMVVRFSPSTEELIIRLDTRPTGGTLELSSSTDRQISAQIAAHARGEEMMVLPGELRVLNSPASTADYRVKVSAAVRVVRVIIGSSSSRTVRVTEDMRESIRLDR
ncbi:MAG TPA: hypothetical protein VIP11_17740, partial [Gemmatimonadaceae bacterium]